MRVNYTLAYTYTLSTCSQSNKRPKGLALGWQKVDRGRNLIITYVYVFYIVAVSLWNTAISRTEPGSVTWQEIGANKIPNFVVSYSQSYWGNTRGAQEIQSAGCFQQGFKKVSWTALGLQVHLEQSFSWFKKNLEGECRRVVPWEH
jgi:hypothetical protein